MTYHISIGAVVSLAAHPHKVLLLYRNKTQTFHLPKGTMELGETFQETITREVQEEAGIHIIPKKIFADAESSFIKDNTCVIKKTFYVYATSVQEKIICTDKEHDSGEWFYIDDAIKQLETNGGHKHFGYENEITILKQYNQLYVNKESD